MTGQVKRLRADDGIHFTMRGYLKLAHFVEKELRSDLNLAKLERNIPLAGNEEEQAKVMGRDVVPGRSDPAQPHPLPTSKMPQPIPIPSRLAQSEQAQGEQTQGEQAQGEQAQGISRLSSSKAMSAMSAWCARRSTSRFRPRKGSPRKAPPPPCPRPR